MKIMHLVRNFANKLYLNFDWRNTLWKILSNWMDKHLKKLSQTTLIDLSV